MNKKDLKELSKPQPITPAESTIPLFTREDFRAAIEAVVKELQPKEQSRILDEPWFRLYTSVIGGQAGWLASAYDLDKLRKRLETLGSIATSALNHAIQIKMVTK